MKLDLKQIEFLSELIEKLHDNLSESGNFMGVDLSYGETTIKSNIYYSGEIEYYSFSFPNSLYESENPYQAIYDYVTNERKLEAEKQRLENERMESLKDEIEYTKYLQLKEKYEK